MFAYACGSIKIQYAITMFVCLFVLGHCFVMPYFVISSFAIISMEETDCFTILSSC